ncbi:MAG: S-adenosylmethionine:tRNA ribosyltransferase-isomerase [Actinobacteria bacterium]|nr:S-adenosylmethionine:tRNA ribosyltransferase-isomerase [Actinomycetota bacterium]
MTALRAEALVEEPRRLEDATEPPEARGLDRDEVRLMVVSNDGLEHTRFFDLSRFLIPGDLVVVNTSATLPAAVDGIRADARWTVVHLAAPLDDGTWTIELREPDASGPQADSRDGERVDLIGGAQLEVVSAYPQTDRFRRIVRARLEVDGPLGDYLARFGRPISYCYVQQRWPLAMYQTVFARDAGSAEMPSAGRPFTTELVTELTVRGIAVAPVTLHTGVSSQEAGETPLPERFHVSASTASLVNHTHSNGGRVIAVGTTVTRALESAADDTGFVTPSEGWTDVVLGPDRQTRVVDGLVTGWHAPEASHIELLRAVAGVELVERAYEAARAEGYLWHEFGDSCLLVPERR